MLWCFVVILSFVIASDARARSKSSSSLHSSRNKKFAEQAKLKGRRLQTDDHPHLPAENNSYNFPHCAENQFLEGYIDLSGMLYDCAANIPSPLNPASYFLPKNSTSYDATNVYVQLALNELLSVDDIMTAIHLDFNLRLIWSDPRITFDIWDHINPNLREEGIEITSYIRNEGTPLNFWLPDLYFYESNDIQVVDELIKLLPRGVMYWSRHIIGEFSQAGMAFHTYPTDEQNFTLTMQSFAYDSDFFQLNFIYDEAIDTATFSAGEIWRYNGYNQFNATVATPSPTNPHRAYSTAYVSLDFTRQSRGIIYRLALPVMIFLVVVGASFWAAEDQRIDITLQVLLLASTLYIVIGQSIPFVGYLTMMDNYIITVFVLLAVTVSFHFLIALFTRKAEKYPLDRFYAELLLYIFRCLWIPMAVGMFTAYFHVDEGVMVVVFLAFFLLELCYASIKFKYLKEALKTSILQLRMKEDLVNLRAVDASGRPVRLNRNERFAMYVTEVWYQNPLYKQLLFSNDLAMMHEDSVQPLDPEDNLKTAVPPSPGLSRMHSDHSNYTNHSTLGRMPTEGKQDSVLEMSTLLKTMKRQQSSLNSQTYEMAEVEDTLGGSSPDKARAAESVEARNALKDFKKTTLARMGYYLPPPNGK